MSPILVRPVREQFEHDRIIRVLQARYKRKYEVAINPGAEQNASVDVGTIPMYPDVVLYSQERGRRLQGTIEVETTESINTLEAMAEWAQFGRLRVPFYLYVPPNSVDTARRLCAEHQVEPAEIWTYHMAMDQIRFTMVHRSAEAAASAARSARAEKARAEKRPAAKAAKGTRPAKAAKSVKKAPARSPRLAKPARPAKPARKAASAKAVKTVKRR